MMARLPPNSPLPEYGSLIGSWIVGRSLGSGSYGTVFRAAHRDRPEDESYALKLALRAGDERFEREARLLSRIRHSSVPRFEASGMWRSPEGDAYPYVVMQRVEGMNVYAWALEHGLTLRQAIRQLAQVARALQAVHQHGVHRDVKGGNIRVSDEGHAVLLDFGSGWYPGASPLTGNAMPPGTKPYRSPQLLMFEFALRSGVEDYSYPADPADDVYALGVTAYRLLAGDYPPRVPDPGEGSMLKEPEQLKPPRGLEAVCPELGELIVRMLHPDDPKARGSAGEVAEELEALLEYTRASLDERWVADASRQSTEEAAPPAPQKHAPPPVPPSHAPPPAPQKHAPPPVPPSHAPPPVPREHAWREWAHRVVVAGCCLLLALPCVLLPRNVDRTGVAHTEPEREAQAAEKPDAGTSLGEEGLASISPAETPHGSERKVGRKVPNTPLPDQKRPPCDHRSAKAIKGGCWLLPMGADKAPCEPNDYEHEGRCYFPLLISAERVPTSEDPP
jgi:serine/threonine protein kinase